MWVSTTSQPSLHQPVFPVRVSVRGLSVAPRGGRRLSFTSLWLQAARVLASLPPTGLGCRTSSDALQPPGTAPGAGSLLLC